MSASRVLRVTEQGVDAVARAAAEALGAGELVVMPTDTVYGLAASLRHAAAIEEIFRAKQRPPDMPLPVLVASIAEAEALVPGELETHEQLLSQWWPGALTVIVQASPQIPGEVTAGGPTVGLREPDSEIARAVLHAAGGAAAVTSANLSGDPPATEVAELPDELLRHIAVVIDAGRCPGGTASTVLDLSRTPPRVLREGPVGVDDLRRLLPDLET